MRTTVELSNDRRARLMALAAKRGLRGYSELVREAVDRYLEEEDHRERRLEEVLALAGSISEEEAETARQRIAEVWQWGGSGSSGRC